MRSSRILVLVVTIFLWLSARPSSHAAELIGGDSIGPDSSATDFNGGFAAVQGGIDTIGEPAVEIAQDGLSHLDSMRVIVHGVESVSSHDLRFDAFDYKLKLWKKADYLGGLPPLIVADVGEPVGVVLIHDGKHIVPSVSFGEASYDPLTFSRPSYDFQFDLAAATINGSMAFAFEEPLAAGDLSLHFNPITMDKMVVSTFRCRQRA